MFPVPRSFSVADARGAARLVTDAVVGAADVAEATHATVLRPVGRPRRTRGLTGWIYRLVRALTRRVGRTVDGALAVADRVPQLDDRPAGAARETIVAALNGAFGDRLAAEGNALATTMHLRHDGRPIALDAIGRAVVAPSDVLLVAVHGICMHDGQWGRPGHDPLGTLADAMGATPLALRYNSGRHISENGRDFAATLDALVAAWPVPIRRLVLVGHSMGGLIARSAFHYAAEAGHAWPARDVSLVMLGSPHHGSPLERLGNAVDTLLGATRWAAPFARIGQIRSVGVTDLRHGALLDEDWTGRDRFLRAPDDRTPVPLPPGVACYAVAATTGDGRGGARDQTVGDGLVPLDSALGRHADPARDLGVPTERQWIASGMTHFDLLRRPEVTAQLLAWLAPAGEPDAPAASPALA